LIKLTTPRVIPQRGLYLLKMPLILILRERARLMFNPELVDIVLKKFCMKFIAG